MGAWDYNSFDNDDALDWLAEVEASTDLTIVTQTVETFINNIEGYLEAPECCMMIAAVEVVAGLNGRSAPHFPDTLNKWLAGKPKPSTELINQAQQALQIILTDSELKELWQENPELYPLWVASVTDIQTRLSI